MVSAGRDHAVNGKIHGDNNISSFNTGARSRCCFNGAFLKMEQGNRNTVSKSSCLHGFMRNVNVEHHSKKVQTLKESIFAKMRQNYKAEMLKDDSTVRAYRDLYWSLGIDPTKTRPSGEALLRRILHGNDIHSISNVVDAYNLASLETIIPLSGFDLDLIVPPLEIRFSNEKDAFKGIGMDKPAKFTSKVLLVVDRKQVLCVYPYRDADATKITDKTHNVLIIGYGAPGITEAQLVAAVEKALTYIEKAAGGSKETVNVFQSNL